MGRIENHDGKAWRARAEECRAIADTFDNPETRAKMYLVAEDYERMAEHAERRAKESAVDEVSPSRKSGSGDIGAAAD